MSRPIALLHIEDDDLDMRAFLRMVHTKGLPWKVSSAETLATARAHLAVRSFDVIVADYHLPDGNSAELFDEVAETPFILVTGTLEEELAIRTLERGADDYLSKDRALRYLDALPLAVEKTIQRKLIREREQQLSRQLVENQAQLEAVFGSMAEGLIIADLNGRIRTLNPAALRLHGFADDEEARQHIGDYTEKIEVWDLSGQSLPPEQWPITMAIRGVVVVDRKLRVRNRKTGQEFIGSYSGGPVQDREGKTILAVTVIRDITEHKAAEAQLHLQAAAMEAADNGIAITDARGTIVWTNPAFGEMIGYSIEETIGLNPRILKFGEHGEEIYRELRDTLHRGEMWRGEVVNRRKDGTLCHEEMTITPLPGEGGTRFIAIKQDITARIRAEEALAAAKLEAERARDSANAANEARGQFLANVSHEIRTPMNAIIGLTGLALEEGLSPSVRDALETVKGSADSLLVLLNELLDFSRIESGKLQLESCSFYLRGEIEDALKMVAVPAQEKGLWLHNEIAEDVPDELVSDSLRTRQIVINLVGNAIKFTENGGVTVRVEVESCTAKEADLKFEVTDTGIGIAPEHQTGIFDPFSQAEISTTRRFGGTGLGLAITSKLVELMGGHLAVKSEVGHGSTFYFTARFLRPSELTAKPCESEAPSDGELAPLMRPLRILLAEDTAANQKLMVRILGKRGHIIDVAADGQEAVDLVNQQDYDLVLMDVQMPVMDGFQATAEIRILPDPRKARLPIVAMTAHAMKGDRERCLDSGMDEYISKPVDARELIRVVESQASKGATIQVGAEPLAFRPVGVN